MTSIDRTELDRLRELAAAATPGPWEADGRTYTERDKTSYTVWGIQAGKETVVEVGYDRDYHTPEAAIGKESDAEFIAYANPQRVTRLVGLVEELTGGLRDLLTWMSAVAHADTLADDDASGTSMELDFQATQILEAARVLLDRLGAT